MDDRSKAVDMFTLTYGEVVNQVVKDCNCDTNAINTRLDDL